MSNFKTKEEYQDFISAWKSATNAEEAKSKRVVCDHEQYFWYNPLSNEEKAELEKKGAIFKRHSYIIPMGGHYKEKGWINAEHHIFYNMMLGKDPKRGFVPKLKKKPEYGQTPWIAFEQAAYKLERAIINAEFNIECIGKGQVPVRHVTDDIERFLKPFGGKIKPSDLLRIDKEELRQARKFHR